ncbi:MAG TPA: hypothetical protein VFL62_12900 [Bradyrhizobium sp.]|uniref:hypothetical protein n=1 Tax=Bradyrhizobium sp. TaxID=376 RepID=UPI002D80904A|nr:hypothetical protein [Bradyrhizobium sp.]HET7887119.1 hypothetical protein [Bradyrhizobium sp.]
MKKLLLTAALFAYASPALAGSFVTTSNCRFSGYYGYVNCYATRTYVPDPIIDLEQERREAAERHKEDLKWEAFCKPKFRTDAYGMRRASYTRSGCEFGRSE